MPRNASGVYAPPSGTTAVSGSVIAASEFNNFVDDVGSEITGSLPRNGAAGMNAPLAMGGNKITGIANGSNPTDAMAFGQFVPSIAFPSGTIMLFVQTAAPVGWTKLVTDDNKALRIVSGTVTSGGTAGFTSVFGAAKTTGSHVLTQAELPTVTFPDTLGVSFTAAREGTSVSATGGSGKFYATDSNMTPSITGSVTSGGSDTGHTHTLSLDLKYLDVIQASKD